MTFVNLQKNDSIGELVLSSPATLNALTHADIIALHKAIATLEADSTVQAIVIRSDSEKAFCAGGDMKQIRQHILAGQFDRIEKFFIDEYALNLAISRCTKPYIALMQGIAMGGGLGISVHGSFRVVTEKSVLAMPESRIGFFPDVGASYFLTGLPQRAGYWLGLTSMAVKGHEAVQVGLATHYVMSEHLEALNKAIRQALKGFDDKAADKTRHQIIETTLNDFAAPYPDNDFDTTLAQREQWFTDSNLDAIRLRLTDASQRGNEDAKNLLTMLDAGSPYSTRVTIQLFDNTLNKDLQQCLDLELALGAEAVRYPDCAEGVRSVLVDKDRNPHWK